MINRKKYLRFSDFFKYLNYHPYFIFNSEITEIDPEDIEEDELLNQLQFDIDDNEIALDNLMTSYLEDSKLNEYKNLDTYLEKYEFASSINSLENNFHNKLEEEKKLESFQKLLKNFNRVIDLDGSFDIYKNQATDFIIETFKKSYNLKQVEILIISKKEKKELAIQKTLEAINSGKIKLIINPCLCYENIISEPFYYLVPKKQIGSLFFSSKTSSYEALQAKFNAEIFSSNKIGVDSYYFCSLHYNKKDDLRLFAKGKNIYQLSNLCNINKTRKNFEDGTKNESFRNIIEIVQEDSYIKSKIYDFSKSIERYYENESLIKLPDNLIDNQYLLNFDYGDKCKYQAQILRHYFPEIKEASATFYKDFYLKIDDESKNLGRKFYSNPDLILVKTEKYSEDDTTLIRRFFDESYIKFVWFDFEGVTNTVPIIDYHKPFTQLVCQTSIIKTEWDKSSGTYKIVEDNIDYIYDPKNYSYLDLIKIIEDIYDEKAKGYVVYNQTYEKSRLNEIITILKHYHQFANKISKKDLDNLTTKKDHIVNNMIDIAKFVATNNLKNFNEKLFAISYLKLKYSIKSIEKYITAKKIKLPHQIVPYSELNIKNGMMALTEAMLRCTGKTGDRKWEEKTSYLKKYCHNDVMAMIMAADFFWMLWNNKKQINKKTFEALGLKSLKEE
ncbi:DUF2779 domain-containing protein [Metamycoplasma hyosynoviae]|uniref:UU173 family protein n=1 Tax=Metamycoplasma hyosynoviae TaxID=29559 RepID=UPI002366D8AE|nr:DUF2779 domain-containing protein [Metamycoplasma hyosynoviae]MDD7837740.1 DUF2779 domain-containing protein [Metamycoplasma hyosynoviae]